MLHLVLELRFYILYDSAKKLIFGHSFWLGLNPNSIATINESIYVGMMGGYAKINIKKNELSFYQFKKLPKLSKERRKSIRKSLTDEEVAEFYPGM